MLEAYKELPIWFRNRLKKVMEHNEYPSDCVGVENCLTIESWTPVDLIVREELNNGGGSAKGFLGLSTSDCHRCYKYIKENKEYFIAKHLVNESARNNCGFPLWHNYNF